MFNFWNIVKEKIIKVYDCGLEIIMIFKTGNCNFTFVYGGD